LYNEEKAKRSGSELDEWLGSVSLKAMELEGGTPGLVGPRARRKKMEALQWELSDYVSHCLCTSSAPLTLRIVQARAAKNVWDVEICGVVVNRQPLDLEATNSNAVFANSKAHAEFFQEVCWTSKIQSSFLPKV
jgi:hypothetical protein